MSNLDVLFSLFCMQFSINPKIDEQARNYEPDNALEMLKNVFLYITGVIIFVFILLPLLSGTVFPNFDALWAIFSQISPFAFGSIGVGWLLVSVLLVHHGEYSLVVQQLLVRLFGPHIYEAKISFPLSFARRLQSTA